MATILLTGASGMLGRQILSRLKHSKEHKVFTVCRSTLHTSENHFIGDISIRSQLMDVLNSCRPEIVINCAAYVNLDYCEKKPKQADCLHEHAVAVFSSYPSVRYVYQISTDSVFDGQRGSYNENDVTNPLNYYALSKLNGEVAVLQNAKNGYVLRTNILGFNSALGASLFEWAYKNLSLGKSIMGYTNVFFNPLYVGDLAEMLIAFTNVKCASGVYNFASQPPVSKYGALIKIAETFGFDTNLIAPTELDVSQSTTIRPLNTSLNTDKISTFGIKIPTIETCIYNLYNDFLKQWH